MNCTHTYRFCQVACRVQKKQCQRLYSCKNSASREPFSRNPSGFYRKRAMVKWTFTAPKSQMHALETNPASSGRKYVQMYIGVTNPGEYRRRRWTKRKIAFGGGPFNTVFPCIIQQPLSHGPDNGRTNHFTTYTAGQIIFNTAERTSTIHAPLYTPFSFFFPSLPIYSDFEGTHVMNTARSATGSPRSIR